jgi:signal transduction histidine kinase
MSKDIYKELAGLRPERNKRKRKTRDRPAGIGSEQVEVKGASPDAPSSPAPEPRRLDVDSLPTGSKLGASLKHLRGQAPPAGVEPNGQALTGPTRLQPPDPQPTEVAAKPGWRERLAARREQKQLQKRLAAEEKAAAKQARVDRKEAIAGARVAVKEQKQQRKENIATARKRAKSRRYHRRQLPDGDFTRKERRQLLADIRADTEARLEMVTSRETAALESAKAALERLTKPTHPVNEEALERSVAGARLDSIRASLGFSWLGILSAAWYLWDRGFTDEPDILLVIGLASGFMFVMSVLRWSRIAGRRIGSFLLFIWLTMALTTLVALAPFLESELAVLGVAVWALLFGGVLLPSTAFALATVGTLACYVITMVEMTHELSSTRLALPLALLAATGAFISLTVRDLRGQAVITVGRMNAINEQREILRQREADLMQLYDVSRTIGAGENVQDVLPELVARTAGYVAAKVGVFVLHRTDESILETLSPIWVSGQALEAQPYIFDDDSSAVAARVFQSRAPVIVNQLTEDQITHDQLLADLGVERLAAVPLVIENNPIGVLMVADKTDEFTMEDLNALELLAAPAALVVDHIVRYQTAQETSRKMAEVAQLKSDFVSVVSHELRTPLTSVIGALSTLSRPELAPENPTSLSLLESATSQAKRLRDMIEDLLTVSKVDNQALPVEFETIDVADFLASLLSTVDAWSDVELDLAPAVPPIDVDIGHLQRVLTNLLDNAHKYGGDQIVVTARAVQDEVWISVIDHGEGIPFEYQSTVFERFTQIERADTRIKGGTGLGLNIAKDLTEAMNGHIWLDSTPGGGATFVVAFPRSTEELRQAQLIVGPGMSLVDPSRDRVEAPISMDDLAGGSDGPVAE